MCMVSHGYGGLGGGRDDMHAGEVMGVGRMLGDAGALPVCEVKILMTSDHTAVQVHISG